MDPDRQKRREDIQKAMSFIQYVHTKYKPYCDQSVQHRRNLTAYSMSIGPHCLSQSQKVMRFEIFVCHFLFVVWI